MAAGPTVPIVQAMGFLDKAKSLLGQHDEQVDQALAAGFGEVLQPAGDGP